MSEPRPFNAPDAPAAVGPYSHGVDTGDLVFLSGQIPLDPATGALVGDDVAAQTERVIANLRAVLGAAGLGLRDVIKTNVYLTDLAGFAAFNEVYGREFGEWRPARSTVQVAALPRGASVEIEVVARRTAAGASGNGGTRP